MTAGCATASTRDDPDLDKLMESLKEYGQQVPVLLRVNPNDPERYQVVYGRRRVAAMKRLGLPVKALIRDLDDRALVIAQGQENTARKDLTFIEKANFARQMRDAGYDRKTICDALSIDKTVISRMLQVVDAVPEALIKAIGSAPSFGRDRWLALANALDGRDMVAEAKGETSDARFAAVMAALRTPRPPSPAPRPVKDDKGPAHRPGRAARPEADRDAGRAQGWRLRRLAGREHRNASPRLAEKSRKPRVTPPQRDRATTGGTQRQTEKKPPKTYPERPLFSSCTSEFRPSS